MQITCQACGASAEVRRLGEPLACPACHGTIGRLAQLAQALARWYEPRRWRADLVEPNIYFLIERLWTANGQGERLYQAISPRFANYDVFCHLVTRLIARGIDDDWAEMRFPDDPLAEDPAYHLHIRDTDRFAREVEGLFPEVDWDEQIQVPARP